MDAGRPTELTLVHAIDTAAGAHELVEAINALASSCAETGTMHDMNVALMALHPHIASPHVDVRDATLDALETLLTHGSFTSLSLLTLVRTCLPPTLARLHDTPKAEMLIRHMVRIVYHTHVSVRESEAPHTVLERIVRDQGLAATLPQVRAQVLRLLPILQQDGARWPMRMYLTELADNLQHADAHVREVAKTAVLALLHDAPAALKSELRDELSLRDVHPAVLDEIVRGLGGSKRPLPDELTALPDDVKPVYLLSRYDLDHAFQQAAQALEGKETELNWQLREKAVVAMRGMIRAQVPPELVAPFLAHVRQVQDGLLKTVRETTNLACESTHNALDAYHRPYPPAGTELWYKYGADHHGCIPYGPLAHGRLYEKDGRDCQPAGSIDHPRLCSHAARILANAPGGPPGQEPGHSRAYVQAHPGRPQCTCTVLARAPWRPRRRRHMPYQGLV